MLNQFSELRNKEIIHVCEGCRLGYMHDLTIELETGRIVNIIVPGPCRFLGLFGMNTGVPFEGTLSGFWIVLGISGVLTAIVTNVMWRRKMF